MTWVLIAIAFIASFITGRILVLVWERILFPATFFRWSSAMLSLSIALVFWSAWLRFVFWIYDGAEPRNLEGVLNALHSAAEDTVLFTPFLLQIGVLSLICQLVFHKIPRWMIFASVVFAVVANGYWILYVGQIVLDSRRYPIEWKVIGAHVEDKLASICSTRVRNFVTEMDRLLDENPKDTYALYGPIRKYLPAKGCNVDEIISIARTSRYFVGADDWPLHYVIAFRSPVFDFRFALLKRTGDIEYPVEYPAVTPKSP